MTIEDRSSEAEGYTAKRGVHIHCKGMLIQYSHRSIGINMTAQTDFSVQANDLMIELNDATNAMMGMVGMHQTTGPLWIAAAARQGLSFGRWNAFVRGSDMFGQALI